MIFYITQRYPGDVNLCLNCEYNCCYIILHYLFVGQSNAYTLSDIPTLLRLHLHTCKSVGDKWGWCLGARIHSNFVVNFGVVDYMILLIEMPGMGYYCV